MSSREIILDIRLWKVLLGTLLVIFAFFVYRRTFPQLPVHRRFILGVLRAAVFSLLVLFVLDPSLVAVVRDTGRPLVLALVDVSRSMSITDCNGRSRLECSLDGIGILGKSLGDLSDADLEVVPFAGSLLLGGADTDGIPAAEGEGTDIAGALREAQVAFRHRNVRGIVLLTDGRVTRGMLAPVSAPGIPVYAVGVGDTLAKPDLSIEDILFERVNYVGTSATAEVTLSVPGFGDRTITVHLLEGEKLLDRATATPGKGAAEIGATLRYVPDREGMKKLAIEVVPLAGEESTENNREFFRVRVLREKIRILYIDELADWNFTFLRSLVERSERMEIETVVWKPGRGFVTVPGDDGFAFPSGPGELMRYDLVILSDDRSILAEHGNAAALARYVEQGGGLLLLADEHSPLTASRIPRELEGIIPVAGQPSVELGEYHVSVPVGGTGHPLAIAFGDRSNPPPLLARIGGLEVSSAATVPLVMSDRSGTYPFLAFQRSGEGVAAVILGFPVWRWRLAGSEEGDAYTNFLGGLVQYLAGGGEAPALTVETSRAAYRSGEPIPVTAYTPDRRSIERIRGEIYRLDGEDRLVRTFLFAPDMMREGYARTTIGSLEPGNYRMTVSETGDEGMDLQGQTEFSVLPASIEFLESSRDMVLLKHIASLSGGRVMELESIEMLPRLMDLEPVVRERKEIDELRASPLLLIAMLLLLTLEWVLRKLWGLV